MKFVNFVLYSKVQDAEYAKKDVNITYRKKQTLYALQCKLLQKFWNITNKKSINCHTAVRARSHGISVYKEHAI